jgi:hypothetical protein
LALSEKIMAAVPALRFFDFREDHQRLDYLIAIVQNIQLLIDHAWPRPRAALTLDVAGTLAVPASLPWYRLQI